MRVLANVEHLGPNDGVAISTFQMCRELARRGHEVDIAYLNSGPFEGNYRDFARKIIRVRRFHYPRNRPWQALYPMGPAVLSGARLKPDVVYDNLLWTLPWSAGVARLTGAGLVGHMRGFHPGGPSRQQRLLMSRRVRDFIAVSEFSRGQLASVGVDPSLVKVVHNGIDPSSYPIGDLADRSRARIALGLPPDSFVLLFLGRVDPNKGIETLLDAVRSSDYAADIEVVVAGRPVNPGYLSAVQERGRGVNCHWHPERADVVTLLHAADVLVAPSSWDEPFGRSVIEALATGRPVLASRVGGIPEILDGALDQWLFDRGDVRQLADRINRLRHWRVREPALGRACAEHAHRRFNLAGTADAVEALLLDSATRSRSQRPRRNQ